VLAKVLGNRELLESSVGDIMEASFPLVDVDASAGDVTRELQASPVVLVEEYGRITGIITRHDVLDMPAYGARW
jgi:predicted transcriptional regulator